jgi:hypothetical protein
MTITKIELTQINTRLANELAEARLRISQLEADVVRVTEVASAVNTMRKGDVPARAPYVMPQWQIDRAECMARAKELAVSSGRAAKA